MIRRPPRSTQSRSSAASDVYKRQVPDDSANSQNLASLQLTFSRKQLIDYTKWRIEGLDRKSSNWMNKAAEIVCNCTLGVISKLTMDTVRKSCPNPVSYTHLT